MFLTDSDIFRVQKFAWYHLIYVFSLFENQYNPSIIPPRSLLSPIPTVTDPYRHLSLAEDRIASVG